MTRTARSYRPIGHPIATILLFHQAGADAAEYEPIAPKLVALGYAALAVDQRPGMPALRDMEAALAWARTASPGSPIFAWGSSYSASLVFRLAADHPRDVAAVLAFSPAEYFSGAPHFVRTAARHVHVPVFIDSASDPRELDAAKALASAVASRVTVRFVPSHGIHGASTLRDDRDPAGASENWGAVIAFLARLRAER